MVLSPQQREALCADYLAGETTTVISARYGIRRESISRVVRRAGLPVRTKRLSRPSPNRLPGPVEAAVQADYLAGKTTTVITATHGIDRATITRIMKRNGIALRTKRANTYSLNESAFDTITEESAYWIGLLMADGNVRETPGAEAAPQVVLTLARKDAAHVAAFLRFLGSDSPLRLHAEARGYQKATARVSSARVVAALARYGVVPRKSLTAKVIGLEADRHFWRGVVDGDGTVRWDKDGSPRLSLCGSRFLVDQFRSFVLAHCPETKAQLTRHCNIFVFTAAGTHACTMARILYGDCSIALPRKLKVARELQGWRSSVDTSYRGNRTTADWEALRAELGSWDAVAASVGVATPCLRTWRRILRRREATGSPERPETPSR